MRCGEDGGGGCENKSRRRSAASRETRKVQYCHFPRFATKKALTKIFVCVAVCTSKHATRQLTCRALGARPSFRDSRDDHTLAIGRPRDRQTLSRAFETRAMGPNDDGADDQPIADMLRTIEPARRELGDGEAAADGAARPHAAPPGALTPPVSKGTKRKVGASGYRGVAFHQVSGKYRARITSSTGDGRQRALGYFPTKEEAARAWDRAARELGWAEECMNFPASGSAFPGAATAGAPAASPPPPPAFRDHDPGPGPARNRHRASGFHEAEAGGDLDDDARNRVGAFEQSVVASSAPESAAEMNRDVSSSSRLPGALPADRRRRAGNGTGCKGVRFKGNGMYEARIKLRDRPNRTCLGRFKSALEAMRAYDDAARVAGYCVNECGAVGDLLDSDTYAQIGVATQSIAKGVKTVTKAEATALTCREKTTATAIGNDASASAAAANRPGAGASGDGGGAPGDAASAEGPSAAAANENGVVGVPAPPSMPAPLTAAQIGAAAESEPLYAGFILDKPGIHRFLGVFASPEAAHATVKATVPEWKRKNELKQKTGILGSAGGGGKGRATGGAETGGGGGGDRGQTPIGGGVGPTVRTLESSLADDVANA